MCDSGAEMKADWFKSPKEQDKCCICEIHDGYKEMLLVSHQNQIPNEILTGYKKNNNSVALYKFNLLTFINALGLMN